jgi:hypothetical protein
MADPLEPSNPSDPSEESGAKVATVSEADLQIGPYELIRTLVDAPGASFVEARDADGTQWLLQLAFLRATEKETDDEAEHDYIKMVEAATQHIGSDPDVMLQAHGAVKQSDGSTTLYWALPWPQDAYRLGHAKQDVSSTEELIWVARALLERMASRHDRGRLEPLLSELVLIVRKGTTVLVGVPLHLPFAGLSDEMVPARLAPEERIAREPSLPGDLWRLGMALKELARSIKPTSEALDRFLDALTQSDPERRLPSAREALLELKALKLGGDEATLKRPILDRSDPAPRPLLPEESTDDSKAKDDREGNENETIAIKLGKLKDTLPGNPNPSDTSRSESIVTTLSEADNESMKTLEGDFQKELERRMKKSAADRALAAERADTLRRLAASPTIAEPNIVAEKRKKMAERSGDVEAKPRPELPPRSSPASAEIKAREARAKAEEDLRTLSDQVTARHLLGADTVVDGRVPDGVLQRASDVEFASMDTIPPKGKERSLVLQIENPDDPAAAVLNALTPAGTQVPPRNTVWDQAKARTAPTPGAQPGRGPKGTLMGTRPLGPQGTIVGVRLQGAQFKIVSMRDLMALGPGGTPGQAGVVPPPRMVADAGPTDARLLQPGPLVTEGQPNARDPANTQAPIIAANVEPPREIIREVIREVEVSEPWRRYVVDVLAVIIVSVGLAFAFHRFLPEAPKAPKPEALRRITDATEVRLDVTPPDALVIAEDDGRILGSAPLVFLVPPGVETAVLVTAKNFEPQRIVLPERGRVSTALLPLEYHDPCDVDLSVPQGVQLEGVGGELQAGTKAKIPSALIVRALPNEGAWLVRCPELGGASAQVLARHSAKRRVTLSITDPKDTPVYLQGVKIGMAPVETATTSRFMALRIGDGDAAIDRWVPVFADTDVRISKHPAP